MWYKNLDKLIKHINKNSSQHGIHLIYSTPSCYLKVLNLQQHFLLCIPSYCPNSLIVFPSRQSTYVFSWTFFQAVQESEVTLPTKDDDFFPYASDPHAYWTGYFTSRYRQLPQFTHIIAKLYAYNVLNFIQKRWNKYLFSMPIIKSSVSN